MRAVHEFPHLPHCTEEVLSTETGPAAGIWSKWCQTCGGLILVRIAKDSAYVAQWVPIELGRWLQAQLLRNQEVRAQVTDAGN